MKDIPAIIQLWEELISCHRKRYNYVAPLFAYKKNASTMQKRFLAKNIRSRNCIVLVAESRGELVGYAVAGIKKLPKVYLYDTETHLGDIYLKQGHRRKGTGRRFLSEIARWGKKKEVFSIGLSVNVLNKDAIKSYRKMGFKEHHLRMSKLISYP